MRVRSPWFGLYVVGSLAGIFLLPLFVPVPPSGSISYLLGFNNRISLAALLVALAVGGLALRGLPFVAAAGRERAHVPRSTLYRALLATTVLCGVMTLVAAPTWGMDESTYLVGRVKLTLAGQRPYQDFEFLYGPALLYLPAWTARALHIGAGPAYFLVWTAEWLLGVLMMAFVIHCIGFPSTRVRLAFWLLWSIFLSSLVNTGETYTPFRQLAALFALLAVHRVLAMRPWWLVFVVCTLFAAGLLLVSPELALAFMLASSLYLALSLWRTESRRPSLAWAYASMLVAYASSWGLASRLHEFDSARQFGSGGSDIPLILTPTTFLALAGFLLAVAYAARCVRDRAENDARLAAVLLGLAVLPGAMGRADPSHLVLYGLALLLVALSLASACSVGVWRASVALGLVLFSGALLEKKLVLDFLPFFDAVGWLIFPPDAAAPSPLARRIDAVVLRRWGDPGERALMRELQHANADPHALYPTASAVLFAPFGYVVRGREKQIRREVDLGYFDGTIDLMSPSQVRRKIAELQAQPGRDLLLPAGFSAGTGCREDPAWAVNLLRLNFGYSYLDRQRHVPHLLDPICDFIGNRYRRLAAPQRDESLYDLWRRADPGQSPPDQPPAKNRQ